MLILALLVGITPQTAEAVARAAALEAAQDHRFDVVSELDIKEMADFEADKQACGSTESCASQLAGAYDARLVLFLSLYPVGQELHAQMTLRDLKNDVVIHRVDAMGLDEPTLFAAVRTKTREALSVFVPDSLTTRPRLFVSRAAGVFAAESLVEAVDGAGPSPMLIGGLAGAGGGVALAVIGTLVGLSGNKTLEDATAPKDDKNAALAQRTGGYVVAGVGGAVVVAGAILTTLALTGAAP